MRSKLKEKHREALIEVAIEVINNHGLNGCTF